MRTYSYFALLLIVAGLSACSPARTASKIRMMFDPPPRVIFGPEDAERWIAEMREWICQDSSPCSADEAYIKGNVGLPFESESYWRPTPAQVKRFEQELARGLKKARSEWQIPHDPPRPLWQYSVQYIGFIRDGERLIYANGSCGYEPAVRERWFMILDGGACVFGASFNPETAEFSGVGFNGYA